MTALVRGSAPESLVDIAYLVFLGRPGEELVGGRHAKIAFGFRIGGGFLARRPSRVTACDRNLERLERQRFAEGWFAFHALKDASAVPSGLTRTSRRLQTDCARLRSGRRHGSLHRRASRFCQRLSQLA